MFKDLSLGLKENLVKVYVLREKEFKNENVYAHVHRKSNVLCLSEDSGKDVLFHEATHVRHNVLNKNKSDFSKKWKEIADFKYGRKNIMTFYRSFPPKMFYIMWKDGKVGPKNGCLNPYSAKFFYEDVATFVESLGYLHEKESAKKTIFPEYYPLFFADTSDYRYQKKLDLLKEYNFLTKEEHEKLSKNLGSLNYLLKQKK